MKFVWRILIGGLLLTALIAWMIAERVFALANGREIVVAVQPVDPQDLFRGDYVRLRYDFSEIDSGNIVGRFLHPDDDNDIYAVLKPQDGRYILDHVATTRPDLDGGRAALKGTVRKSWVSANPRGLIWPDYGIGRYFVPQGHGRDIEKAVGEKRTDVVLAVADDGTAVIKALRIDGKEVYREGLF